MKFNEIVYRIGDLRFLPPKPVSPYILPIIANKRIVCPDRAGGASRKEGFHKDPEDCLVVNVQRLEGTTSGSKLPVLVVRFSYD